MLQLPEYEEALDWHYCERLQEASQQLSDITRLLNTVIMITKRAEMQLLIMIADYGDYINEKGSKDNKLIKLLSLEQGKPKTEELFITYKEGKSATSQLKNKKDAIFEHLMALKKIEGIRP